MKLVPEIVRKFVPRPLPACVQSRLGSALYKNPRHPIGIVTGLVEGYFDRQGIRKFQVPPDPAVSVEEAFDSLLVPVDHPSRREGDTFYLGERSLLRPHATAHQAEFLRALNNSLEISESCGAVWTCDVFRRDEVDKTHFPIFHQTDGVRVWRGPNELLREEALADLKYQLEGLVKFLWSQAPHERPPEIRWDESATFPFTDPSLELEILSLEGRWMEVLGCGLIKPELLKSDEVGWAFGLGLERLAMLLFGIDDIRVFWSNDERFAEQFKQGVISKYKPIGKFPSIEKDLSFWVVGDDFSDNVFFEMCREVGSELLESVKLVDSFSNGNRQSKCFRFNFRALDRTLTHGEVNTIQNQIVEQIRDRLAVIIR